MSSVSVVFTPDCLVVVGAAGFHTRCSPAEVGKLILMCCRSCPPVLVMLVMQALQLLLVARASRAELLMCI